MTIVRRYIAGPEDHEALAFENGQSGLEASLPNELMEGIRSYHGTYLPIISSEDTSRRILGKGSIGEATLYEPTASAPFVRKTFQGEESNLRFDGLSVRQMNHLIDLRIMRALRGLPIAAQLHAFSLDKSELISSFRTGRMVTERFKVEEIPDHHLSTWVSGMCQMHERGVTMDDNPTNVLYDPHYGFSVIDALPSSRLILPDSPEQFAEMQKVVLDAATNFEGDPDTWGMAPELLFRVIRNTFDTDMGEHLFEASKFMAYALQDDLPSRAELSSADPYLHELGFQRVFLPCLHRVLWEIKNNRPEQFGSLYGVAQKHFDNLQYDVRVGTGWNEGTVTRFLSKSGGIAADEHVAHTISKIHALAV